MQRVPTDLQKLHNDNDHCNDDDHCNVNDTDGYDDNRDDVNDEDVVADADADVASHRVGVDWTRKFIRSETRVSLKNAHFRDGEKIAFFEEL